IPRGICTEPGILPFSASSGPSRRSTRRAPLSCSCATWAGSRFSIRSFASDTMSFADFAMGTSSGRAGRLDAGQLTLNPTPQACGWDRALPQEGRAFRVEAQLGLADLRNGHLTKLMPVFALDEHVAHFGCLLQ